MIPTAQFPEQLGFVALPYSQGPGFFTNLLLYHELGHFVFEELSSSGAPHLTDLDVRLRDATDQALSGTSATAGARALMLRLLRYWTHEIFCDLFALYLIGPAFSFAFIDLLGLLNVLDSSETTVFNESHPAPAFRFHQHVETLKEVRWWPLLEDVDAPQKATIESLASHGQDEYLLQLGPRSPERDDLLIPTFLRVLPDILVAIREIARPVAVNPEGFASCRSHVEKCLANGIVPSVLLSDQEGPPSPTFIMNASFTFYLTSFEALMERLGKDPGSVKERSVWMQRLESWTQKALEDVLLMKRKAGASRVGSPI